MTSTITENRPASYCMNPPHQHAGVTSSPSESNQHTATATVLSPPLTPATPQQHPFDKRHRSLNLTSQQAHGVNYYHHQYVINSTHENGQQAPSFPQPPLPSHAQSQAQAFDFQQQYQLWMQQQQQPAHHSTTHYSSQPLQPHPSYYRMNMVQPPPQHPYHQRILPATTAVPSPIKIGYHPSTTEASTPTTALAMAHPSIMADGKQQEHRNKMTEKASSSNRNTNNKHMCTFRDCTWSFKRFEHLKRHMLVHTGERPHVCNYPGCGKRFSRSDNFHAHYRTHERKAIKRQQQQSTGEAEKSMSDKNEVLFHNNATSYAPNTYLSSTFNTTTHHLQFPAQQQQRAQNSIADTVTSAATQNRMSSFSASRRSSIKDEQERQRKPHACDHPNCGKKFRRLEHLKRHMRIHTNEQPFKCHYPGCSKAFSRSDNLTQHKKVHERRGETMVNNDGDAAVSCNSSSTSSSSLHSSRSNSLDQGTTTDESRVQYQHYYNSQHQKQQQHPVSQEFRYYRYPDSNNASSSVAAADEETNNSSNNQWQ